MTGQVLQLDDRRCAQEASLLAKAASGDSASFEALISPHLPMMRRVAGRMAEGPSMAEEALQEALELAFTRLDSYQAGTRLGSWLAAIVARRALTLRRGDQRRRQREQRVAVTGEDPPSPEQLVAAQSVAQRIKLALDALPPKRARAATLRLDAGLSYAEIAAELGTSEASARVLVYLAVKTLRQALSEFVQENEP